MNLWDTGDMAPPPGARDIGVKEIRISHGWAMFDFFNRDSAVHLRLGCTHVLTYFM